MEEYSEIIENGYTVRTYSSGSIVKSIANNSKAITPIEIVAPLETTTEDKINYLYYMATGVI